RLHLPGSAGPGQARVLRELRTGHEHHGQESERPADQGLAWHLNRRSGSDLSGLAQEINPQVRGWINYYGAFYRSMLYSLAARIDEHLVRWAMQKFKRLRGRPTREWRWLDTVRRHQPTLLAHWYLLPSTHAGLWEPYDGRPSRTVLRGREGEAPSRY